VAQAPIRHPRKYDKETLDGVNFLLEKPRYDLYVPFLQANVEK
jgi:hypothetical protein